MHIHESKYLFNLHAKRILLSSIAVSTLLGANIAVAQSASQITPNSFAPTPNASSGGIVITPSDNNQAPENADQLFVELGEVVVEGGAPQFRALEQDIVAELSGKNVSAAQIFGSARTLERAYVAAGYGLMRVVLPEQHLTDGAALKIIVIDGFVERVDTSNLPRAVRNRVAKLLSPLVGRRGVKMAALERALLLAGDTPGVRLRSTLAAGTQPGATVLMIEGAHRPVTVSIAADNTLSKQLGRVSTTMGVDLNSVLGLGEVVYLRAGGWPSAGADGLFSGSPRNRSLAAGISVPIGTGGLSFNLETTDARAGASPAAGRLSSKSAFSRTSARLNYALLRGRQLSATLQAGFDAQQERVSFTGLFNQDLSLDRLRVIRVGGTADMNLPDGGFLSARVTGSFGLNGLGARQAPALFSFETPLSRMGAAPSFQKLDASVTYIRPLLRQVKASLNARGQTAFGQTLLNAEQIGLSGATGLSSLPSGWVQGDSGYVVRGELQFPQMFTIATPFVGANSEQGRTGVMLAPYLFGAHGAARLARPTIVERAERSGTAYGVGLQLGAGQSNSLRSQRLSVEFGRYRLSDAGGSGNRLTLATSFQF